MNDNLILLFYTSDLKTKMSEKNNQYDLLSEPNGGSSSSSTSEYELLSNPDQGFPVQIVKVTEDRLFELDVPALESILLRETIRDVPVVIVSIAGDFRKGIFFFFTSIRYSSIKKTFSVPL